MTTSQATSVNFGGDRRPALYGTLVTFLVLNNLAVVALLVAHYRAHYRKGERVFLEDIFVLLSGVRGSPLRIQNQRLTHCIQGLREHCHWQPLRLYVNLHCVRNPLY